MKIVFVQPRVGFKGHTWEALGIGYIVSFLRKRLGTELQFEFFSGFYDSDEQIVRACRDADIVGFGCTSPQHRHAVDLARRIKGKDNYVVFGGVHPTVLPDAVLAEECVDAVVVGEGETGMLEIAESVSRGIRTPKRVSMPAYIRDLDALPFPDRKVIKNERNIQQACSDGGVRTTSVLSTRGCPFKCSFCCSHDLWGRKTRLRSPGNILDEIQELVQDWNIEFLKFSDDTFTVDKQRAIEFCKLKNERGIALSYGANAHVNTVDAELLEHLASSGCRELWYGVESGSPKVLRAMHKSTTVERIKEVFRLTKSYGIKTRAYFLLGMPQETAEDIALTEKLCDELEPDQVGFTLLSPFPGNEYFDKGTMMDWDWSVFDEYSNDWVRTQTISNAQLKAIQKRLVEKYQAKAAFRQKLPAPKG